MENPIQQRLVVEESKEEADGSAFEDPLVVGGPRADGSAFEDPLVVGGPRADGSAFEDPLVVGD